MSYIVIYTCFFIVFLYNNKRLESKFLFMGKLKDLKIQFRNIKMKMSTMGLIFYDFV